MSLIKEKELYKVKSIHDAFYTGREIKVVNDASEVLCHCGSSIQVLDVETGRTSKYLGTVSTEEELVDVIITFQLSNNNELVVSSHKSGLLKLWTYNESIELVKHWKCIHKGAAVKLAISNDNEVLATGGTDSSIRLWDLAHNSCTHNLLGSDGVISVLEFYEKQKKRLLFGAGVDTSIRAWDCSTGSVVVMLKGHFSTVTAIGFDQSGDKVVSCGRDKVLIVWSIASGVALHTYPAYESLEALVVLPEVFNIPNADEKVKKSFYVATGGENGYIRIWDVLKGKEVYQQTNSLISKASQDQGVAIANLIYNEATLSFFVSSVDHNIIVYELSTFSCKKQFVGFSDEVLSIILVGENETHCAVATNSQDIKLYNFSTMSCQLLKGHTAFVVSLAVSSFSPNLFASGSKDHSIRLWLLEGESTICLAVATRHSDSVSSVALPLTSSKFAVSASQDTTLKLWSLPKKISPKITELQSLSVLHTVRAHEKEINDVSLSPNDKLIATASFDKTAKIWKREDLTLLGTLRGHKRSVWCVRFSPVDQVLLTTSGDTTIRLWSVADLSCLKTLEGHDSSVLQGAFLTRGTQIISAGGDGLIKLWSIKNSECDASFDNHVGKIWALAVSKDESELVTGGNDSRLIVWEDWSEQAKEQRLLEAQEKALTNQTLSNLIHNNQMLEALSLAISLNRPKTVYNILQDLVNSGSTKLDDTIRQLSVDDKQALLNFSAHWNTNSKNCYIAQLIISLLLVEISTGTLRVEQSQLEAIIPYTERHFNRLTQLLQDLHFIKYTKLRIDPISANTPE